MESLFVGLKAFVLHDTLYGKSSRACWLLIFSVYYYHPSKLAGYGTANDNDTRKWEKACLGKKTEHEYPKHCISCMGTYLAFAALSRCALVYCSLHHSSGDHGSQVRLQV
jgi:hypothetical protein